MEALSKDNKILKVDLPQNCPIREREASDLHSFYSFINKQTHQIHVDLPEAGCWTVNCERECVLRNVTF